MTALLVRERERERERESDQRLRRQEELLRASAIDLVGRAKNYFYFLLGLLKRGKERVRKRKRESEREKKREIVFV